MRSSPLELKGLQWKGDRNLCGERVHKGSDCSSSKRRRLLCPIPYSCRQVLVLFTCFSWNSRAHAHSFEIEIVVQHPCCLYISNAPFGILENTNKEGVNAIPLSVTACQICCLVVHHRSTHSPHMPRHIFWFTDREPFSHD